MEFVLLTLVNGDRVLVRKNEIYQVVTYNQELETTDHCKQQVVVIMNDRKKLSVKNDFDKLADYLIGNK